MQVLDRDALRADVPGGEHIGVVATYRNDFFVFYRQFKTATRFAEGTNPVGDTGIGGG